MSTSASRARRAGRAGAPRPTPKVWVADMPEHYGEAAHSLNLDQPGGAPVRGTLMSPDDPRIPAMVFHVTTAKDAVYSSGVLRASSQGGLEGDPRDHIVSLTISSPIASGLWRDMRTMATIARAVGPEPDLGPERATWGRQVVRLFQDQAEREGWHWGGAPAEFVYAEYNFGDWQRQYYIARDFAINEPNPIFFNASAAKWGAVDPAQIAIISVPKANLKTGAMLTDFDLGRHSLEEIRLYGDLPLGTLPHE